MYNRDVVSKVETVIRCIRTIIKQMKAVKLDTRVNIYVKK